MRCPGCGALLSFDVLGGAKRADAVCRALRVICHALSLGGVESTIERRAAILGEAHLPPGLVLLRVGREHPDQFWRELQDMNSPFHVGWQAVHRCGRVRTWFRGAEFATKV